MARPRNWPPKVCTVKHLDRVWWNGDWHYLGPTGSAESRAELARLMQLWAVDPHAAPLSPDDYLVATLCRDYLASDACPPTKRASVGVAVQLLLATHLETAVAEFDAPALAAWQAALCRAVKDDGSPKYAVTTVRIRVAAVRRIWKWGVATKRVPVERYQELLTVEGPRPGQARPPKRVRAADPKAVAAALPILRPQTRAMVELQQVAGFRPSDLFRLTPRQVLREGVVDVPDVGEVDLTALGVWLYLPEVHKTAWRGKHRWILLGERSQAILAPFLDRGPDAPCFSPSEATAGRNADATAARKTKLWPSHAANNARRRKAEPERRPGDQYRKDSYRNAVRRACERAGVPPFNPYQIRHRFGVDVDAAFGLDHTQAAMGHDSPQTTRRYSKRSFEKAAEVARKKG